MVRCSGELTIATAESLRRELNLQISLGRPALTVDLSCCRAVDADGVQLLIDTYRGMRDLGRRLVIVSGTDTEATAFTTLRVDGILPVFPTEAAAALALQDGGAPA